jgi:hypothetical protein
VPIDFGAPAGAGADGAGTGSPDALAGGTGLSVILTPDAGRCGAPVPVPDAQRAVVLYDTGARRRWYVAGAPTGTVYPTRLPVPSPAGAVAELTCDATLALTSTACGVALAAAAAACTAAGPSSAQPRLQQFCAGVAANHPGVCGRGACAE